MKVQRPLVCVLCLLAFLASTFSTFKVAIGQTSTPNLPTYSICSEKSNIGNDKSPHLMQLLEFHELDIIGPQKGIFSKTDSETDEVLNITKFPSMESDNSDMAQAVFYNPEKFQLLDQDSFTITHRSKQSEKANQFSTRKCDWGKFKNLEDNRLFYVFNVQSTPDTMNDDKKLILEQIRQINKDGLPYILTGDFDGTKRGIPAINSVNSPISPDNLKDAASVKSAG